MKSLTRELNFTQKPIIFLFRGGSDSHTTWSIAGGGIETEEKITSAYDYLRIMREGKLKSEADVRIFFAICRKILTGIK